MPLVAGVDPGDPVDRVGEGPDHADTGEILELERPKRIRLKWRNEFRPELKAEGFSVCTIEIEPYGDAVRLSIALRQHNDAWLVTPDSWCSVSDTQP